MIMTFLKKKAVCLLGTLIASNGFFTINIDMDEHDIFLIERYYRYRRKESISTKFRRNLFWNGFFINIYYITHLNGRRHCDYSM